jgi:hypothetical protein
MVLKALTRILGAIGLVITLLKLPWKQKKLCVLNNLSWGLFSGAHTVCLSIEGKNNTPMHTYVTNIWTT